MDGWDGMDVRGIKSVLQFSLYLEGTKVIYVIVLVS